MRSQGAALGAGGGQAHVGPSTRQGDALGTEGIPQSPSVAGFSYQHGMAVAVLSPQQFQNEAQYRIRKTMHIGGSTSIHYNYKGAFSVTTSIGPHAHASMAQGGRTRISRSVAGTGFYQRQVKSGG